MGDGGTRWTRSAAAALALALVLVTGAAACSDGGGDGGGPSTTEAETSSTGYAPPNEQALVEAAWAYNTAQIDPAIDAGLAATAHGYLAAACQDETSVVDMEVWLNDNIEQRRIDMGAAADELTVSQISVVDLNTSEAQVLVTLVTPTDDDPLGWGVPMRQTWWVEGGEWRIDPCAEFATVEGGTDQLTPVTVIASGMHHEDGGGRWATNWAAVVRNPNSGAAAYDVEVTIDFVDAEGEVVKTLEESILQIEPGQSGAVAGPADAPDAVKVEVRARTGSWAPSNGPLVIEGAVSRIEQLPLEPGQTDPGTQTVTTLTNTSAVDLGAIPVLVYLDADGAVRGGSMQELMSFGFIPAGGSKEWVPVTYGELPEGWSLRVYVTPTAPDYEWDRIMAEEDLGEP